MGNRQHDKQLTLHMTRERWDYVKEKARARGISVACYIYMVVFPPELSGPGHTYTPTRVTEPGLSAERMRAFTASDTVVAKQAATDPVKGGVE